jgi:hypothetical protein
MQRTVVEGVDALLLGLGVLIDQQFHAADFRHLLAQFVHGAELPRRIDMQQRKRRRGRIESLARQMQHDGRSLPTE